MAASEVSLGKGLFSGQLWVLVLVHSPLATPEQVSRTQLRHDRTNAPGLRLTHQPKNLGFQGTQYRLYSTLP